MSTLQPLTSDTLASLGPDLVKAQQSLEAAVTNASNSHFGSTYADLSSVIDASMVLRDHNLSVLQLNHESPNGVKIQTMLLHSSGEWIADHGVFVPAEKNSPQAYGSALTYARRYGLASLIGIRQADDDANAAQAASRPVAKPRSHSDATTQTSTPSTSVKSHTLPFGRSSGAKVHDAPTADLEWIAPKLKLDDPTYGAQNRELYEAIMRELDSRSVV